MNCPEYIELCADCPLRTMLPETDASRDNPHYIERVGQEAILQSHLAGDGSAYSFSIDYENGPFVTEVAILSEGVKTGPAFFVEDRTWSSGEVQHSFENCDEPTITKSGFLKRKKQIDCTALARIK